MLVLINYLTTMDSEGVLTEGQGLPAGTSKYTAEECKRPTTRDWWVLSWWELLAMALSLFLGHLYYSYTGCLYGTMLLQVVLAMFSQFVEYCRNDVPHGEDKMIYPGGSTYEEGWGIGLRRDKGSYTGFWKKGFPSGRGIYRWCYEAWKSAQFIKTLNESFRTFETGGPGSREPYKSDIEDVFVELKRQSALNDDMVDAIAEKDKVLSEKDEIIAMKDKELASLKSALHKEREIAARDEEIALLEARLKRIGQISGGVDEEEDPQAKRHRTESEGSGNQSANNRASRSRARMVPVKQENIRAGSIKCPDPQCNNIILHNGGCKRLTCTNHIPHYLYFCAHCKKVGEDGSEIIRCDCPNRNTQADRDLAQEMRNQRSRENPIIVE